MLVKLLDFPDELAEQLKRLTLQATASKAVFDAAKRYPAAVDFADMLTRQLAEERERNKVLRQRIEAARSSAALLLESTGQGDLLDESVPVDTIAPARPAVAGASIGTKTVRHSPAKTLGELFKGGKL